MSLRMVTYNVLTLLCPGVANKGPAGTNEVGMRVFGKRDLLKRQLIEAGVHVAALQETRLAASQLLPDRDFFMWHSACTPAGQYGMAIWLRKDRPFLWLKDRPQYIQAHHATVVLAEPRLLIIQISCPAFKCVLLTAHAPHTSAGGRGCEAESFWQAASAAVRNIPGVEALIVMADANAHLGALESPSVGGRAPDAENEAGAAFHCFLQEHDLAAANTFEHCHSGPDHTWCSVHGSSRRLDYVAIPVGWLTGVRTKVLPRFELLQCRDDHLPLQADCTLYRLLQTGSFRSPSCRFSMRPDVARDPAEAEAFVQAIALKPAIPWATSVEQHYAACAWQVARSPPQAKPRQAYLTPETLVLVRKRQAYREYMAQECKERRRRLLLVIFAAFCHNKRRSVFTPDKLDLIWCWFLEVDVSIARAARYLQLSGPSIRRAVRQDRFAYLDGLKRRLEVQDLRNSRELFAALRLAFPQSRKSRRTGFNPLPQVQLPDGTFAASAEERHMRWGTHFAEQEAGFLVSPERYQRELHEQKSCALEQRAGLPVFSWRALPGLAEVERLILSARRRKAAGFDGITVEMLRLQPTAAARRLSLCWPKPQSPFMNQWLSAGGGLMILAKKAGATFRCEDFRSILLACSASKIYHKFLRGRMSQVLQKARTELQCGAMPGTGVEALSLLARAIQGQARAAGKSWALIMFDIKAAFYRVVRQLVVSVPDSDAGLLRVIDTRGTASQAAVCCSPRDGRRRGSPRRLGQ